MEDCWEEYLYEISEGAVVEGGILLTAYEINHKGENKEIFHGTPEELLTKIEKDYA